MRYVIVGNGVASIGAIEGIRRLDKENPITVISAEPYLAYGRPLIANFLRGTLSKELLILRNETFYKKNKVEVMLSRTATELDTDRREIKLDNGEILNYDKSLIATGGVPFVPPIDGLGKNYHTFTTLKDAYGLEELSHTAKTVVVIGGGLIGLKAAESLHDRGVRIRVVELADRLLSASFDDVAGRLISNRLKQVGIELHLNTTVEKVVSDAKAFLTVRLKSGVMIECQGIVVAIGVVPDLKLVKDSAIQTNRGIVVDDFLETSVKGIYSAGDVAETRDLLHDEKRVTPIWPNAYIQGQLAGQNMAGANKSYQGSIPMNSIAFYGIPTISMGIINPPASGAYRIVTRLDEKHSVYRKLVFEDQYLRGAVLVGRIERAGLLTGFIKKQTPIAGYEEALMKEEMAITDFPKSVRQEILYND